MYIPAFALQVPRRFQGAAERERKNNNESWRGGRLRMLLDEERGARRTGGAEMRPRPHRAITPRPAPPSAPTLGCSGVCCWRGGGRGSGFGRGRGRGEWKASCWREKDGGKRERERERERAHRPRTPRKRRPKRQRQGRGGRRGLRQKNPHGRKKAVKRGEREGGAIVRFLLSVLLIHQGRARWWLHVLRLMREQGGKKEG